MIKAIGNLSRIELAPYGINDDGFPYPPNPTQEKLLSWVDAVRANPQPETLPVLWLRGGVGSGKTRGMLAPTIEALIEIPGLRVLWGRQDFKDLKLSVMDTFFEVLPPEFLTKKSEQYHWYDIRTEGKGTRSNSRIYFNGLKDLSGLGSQEFGAILVTEVAEISEQAYRTIKRRCRQKGVPNMIILEGEPPKAIG